MLHPQLRIEQVTAPFDQVLPPGATATVHTLPYYIGRGMTNQLRIEHPDISRRHACLKLLDDYYVLEDLASRNGTFVNAVRLVAHEPRRLQNGDILQLAAVLSLTFIDPYITQHNPNVQPFHGHGLWVDEKAQLVLLGAERLTLPIQQFRLLALLYAHQARVVTREEIAAVLWSTEVELTEQMLDNTVSRLRANLQKHDPNHNYIVTLRSRGYQFVQRP
jgi:DNA-binding winged helix-turn-helix (wHTH) protein